MDDHKRRLLLGRMARSLVAGPALTGAGEGMGAGAASISGVAPSKG